MRYFKHMTLDGSFSRRQLVMGMWHEWMGIGSNRTIMQTCIRLGSSIACGPYWERV